MKNDEINFLEYLGIEEQNLLTSVASFKPEMDLLYDLDQVYQAPVKRLEISTEDSLISQLYLFVHFHLYFSISCLFRSHLAEALSSVRKAIDATLTAYKIILDPDTAEKYINSDNYFKFIKTNIQNERKKDPEIHPLADGLIKVYNACSKYAAHADFDSFVHRRELRENPHTKEKRLLFHYFQKPKDNTEFRFYIIITL